MNIKRLFAVILATSLLSMTVYGIDPEDTQETTNVIDGIDYTHKAEGSSDLILGVGTFNPETGQYEGTRVSAIVPIKVPCAINPNTEYSKAFTSPVFTIENTSQAPIRLKVKLIEGEDSPRLVHYDKDSRDNDEWQKLNRSLTAAEIAMGIYEINGKNMEDGVMEGGTEFWYQSENGEHDMNIINPLTDRSFMLKSKHGMAFSDARELDYKIIYTIELE